MPNNELTVFDLDGTLIGVNSFREISKRSLFKMIGSRQWSSAVALLWHYGLRKAGIHTHLSFKRKIIAIFETTFSEREKDDMASQVFLHYLNSEVYRRFLSTERCIVSTASPYAFVSRMPLKKECRVVSSCQPGQPWPVEDNFKQGKVENLKALLKVDRVQIGCLYTDSEDDRPLMDCSERIYMVRDGIPVQIESHVGLFQ